MRPVPRRFARAASAGLHRRRAGDRPAPGPARPRERPDQGHRPATSRPRSTTSGSCGCPTTPRTSRWLERHGHGTRTRMPPPAPPRCRAAGHHRLRQLAERPRRGGRRRGDRRGRGAGRSRPDGARPRARAGRRRAASSGRAARSSPGSPPTAAWARDRDGDRRPGGQGLRRHRDRRCPRGDEGAEHLLARPVGRGRVAPLRLGRPRDLAGRVLADAEGDRPPHRGPEQRPEPGGHGPRDLLPEGRRQRLRRHRLQLPDRRAGPDLRGPVLARLRHPARTTTARTSPATSSAAATPGTSTTARSGSPSSGTSRTDSPRTPPGTRWRSCSPGSWSGTA